MGQFWDRSAHLGLEFLWVSIMRALDCSLEIFSVYYYF